MRPPFIWTRIEPVEHLPYPEPKCGSGLLASGLVSLGWIGFWACVIMLLTGCATTKRTVFHADGSKEVIEESKPAIEADTKQFVFDAFWAFAPRQRPAEPERSGK